ncbi:MAG: aminoglycoside phosphotransferase family protein [Roseiflexaceae bacterium]|nr:aminoglycoside phosphotransferase family protein [Roseiflexaceae bacterium]
MLATELLPKLQSYCAAPQVRGALGLGEHDWQLTFLAQGEYNINYLLDTAAGCRRVVRVNTGTQIGKPGGAQIAYEAAALRQLAGQAVAPALVYLDASLAALPYGLLVMEYLPGGPLRYDDRAHIRAAAHTLARLHQAPLPPDHPFIVRRPLIDDLAEAQAWLAPFLACAHAPQPVRAIFTTLLEQAALHAAHERAAFPPARGLVHTDVQAHNFVVETLDDAGQSVDATRCRLVDWERPLADDPTYDLAHFLLPTTTQWKCGYTFSPAEREFFLAEYGAARSDMQPAELRERLRLREPFILLRAISWCAGAWIEYTGAGRTIANRDTLTRIELYLQPDYLAERFAGWL